MAKTTTKWYELWQTYTIQGVIDLVLAYAFTSFAIDSGSLLQYFISIVFLFLGIRALIGAAKKLRHGN